MTKNRNKKVVARNSGGQSVPLAANRIWRNPKPVMRYIGGSDNRMELKHGEFVGEVAGSVAYNCTSYPINPGLAATFLWLSAIANRYESYLIKGLQFEFRSRRAGTTEGAIYMAVDYDAADAAPTGLQRIMAYHSAVSAPVRTESVILNCDPSDLSKFGIQRYTRSSPIAANLDIKTYDVGNLHVATVGCADTTVVGELYVTFDIVFMTPQIEADEEQSCEFIGADSISKDSIFGSTPVRTGSLQATASVNTLTFPVVGTYLVGIGSVSVPNGNELVRASGITPGYSSTAYATSKTTSVFVCTAAAGAMSIVFSASTFTSLASSTTYVAKLEEGLV